MAAPHSAPEAHPPTPWIPGVRVLQGIAVAWLFLASALLWSVGPGVQALWSSESKDDRAYVFDREAIANALGLHAALLVPAPYEATVLHVAAERGCPCERRSKPHRQRIRDAFARRAVRFLQVSSVDPFASALRQVLPAAPAAIVLDGQGHVLYAGPYSSDTACLPRSGQVGAVEQRLEAVLAGDRTPLFTPLGVGCLCSTSPST